MANTNIFNPNRGWDELLGFNANWSYGGPRSGGANYKTTRPSFGPWSTRSVGNAGYSFDLTFAGRPIEQVHYIKRFSEQFQTGFFTLIDHDNKERHHVGRFTAYKDDTQTQNAQYTVNATFEEIPGCPMLVYPHNFDGESHWLYAVNDWLNPLIASSSSAAVVQQTPAAVTAGASVTDPSSYELYEPTAAAGDFLQTEYVGYGFRMNFRIAANLGVVNVLFDDAIVVEALDLFTGNAASVNMPSFGFSTFTPSAAVPSLQVLTSLGRHRVKVQATGTTNPGASTPNGSISMGRIQVLH